MGEGRTAEHGEDRTADYSYLLNRLQWRIYPCFLNCDFAIQRKIKQGIIIPENMSLYPKLNIVKTNDFTEYRQTLFGLL
jgi:hypothetical protein